MDYRNLTAPCGLPCFNCPLKAERSSLKTFLLSFVVGLVVFKSLNISLSDSHCRGCRDEEGRCKAVGFDRPCSVYACSQEKGVEFCYECDDFPCDYLHPYRNKAMFLPHNTKVYHLLQIKKLGLETWAKTKAKDILETYYKGFLRLS